jgi:AAA+ ATPase superfamily predicted ATPase
MENPFRYGEVATGEYFTDRAAELSDLEASIRSGQNVVVISPRRFGKTSLVTRAVEHLRRERVLVAYLDLLRTPTKDRLADHLASAIHDGLVAPVERVWQRAIDVFHRLPIRPRVTVNPDGTPSFEFAAGERHRDIDRTIESLLELPGRIAAERKRRVALVLDEFQEVIAIDPHLPALLRAIFQFQGEVAHVFLGSKRHLMQRVFTDENEPLYRSAKPLLLRPIPRAEFAPFIRDRFAATQQRIADEAIARILEITGGQPHDTQQLCHFTWSIAQLEQVEAAAPLVERAVDNVIDAESARYTALWDELSAHQRLVLTAVAAEGAAVFSEAYRVRHRLGAASSVRTSLERLVERDLVERSAQGTYRVLDPFLGLWLERLMSPPAL